MKKVQQIVSVVLCSILSISTIFANGKIVKADEDIVKELKKEVITLKTVEPKDDLKDLMPLKKILKDKKVVAMGEATHGTSEFFKMKHRMFKFLVEEMGFRAFAIEANFGEGEIINNYILDGKSDLINAMNAFSFWTWKTDEVKELIQWMREYNSKAEPKDKIRFYGFDMQNNRWENGIVFNYLNKVNPELGREFKKKIPDDLKMSVEKGKGNEIKKSLDEIVKDFEVNKEDMIKKSSKEEYDLMMQNLTVMKQCLEEGISSKNNPDAPSCFRDECMAANTKWIVEREENLGHGKVMLWAHNAHIYKLREEVDKIKYTNQGYNLQKIYGEEYYALGFSFFKGRFNSRKGDGGTVQVCELKESDSETIDYMFNKLGVPIFYFDLKKSFNNKKVESWFKNNKLSANSIGSVYYGNDNDRATINLGSDNDFDGMIFIQETTEAKDIVYNSKKAKEDNNIKKCDEGRDTTKLVVSATLGVIVIAIVGGIVSKNRKKNISK